MAGWGVFNRGFFLVLIGSFEIAAAARAETVAPLNSLIDFQSFHEIIQLKVSEVPELQRLWEWQTGHTEQVYLAGSCLGRLIQWIARELQTKSVEDLRHTRAPSLRELTSESSVDVDLFLPKTVESSVRALFDPARSPAFSSAFSLDINHEETYADSVAAGGPTFEKLRAGPSHIDDPHDGLRAYYEGRVVFHLTPDDAYYALAIARNDDHSRVAEALRFMRLLFRYPELKADPRSIEIIQALPALEAEHIVRADRREWIQWMLDKLFYAAGRDVEATVRVLNQYGFLRFLGESGFKLHTPRGTDTESVLKRLPLSSAPARAARKLLARPPLHQRFLTLAIGVRDFCLTRLEGVAHGR